MEQCLRGLNTAFMFGNNSLLFEFLIYPWWNVLYSLLIITAPGRITKNIVDKRRNLLIYIQMRRNLPRHCLPQLNNCVCEVGHLPNFQAAVCCTEFYPVIRKNLTSLDLKGPGWEEGLCPLQNKSIPLVEGGRRRGLIIKISHDTWPAVSSAKTVLSLVSLVTR